MHGLGCRFLGRQMLRRHDAFHVFEYDDGVVDHDTDGKHKAKERQGIDGVAKGQHASKGTDNGHGHGYAGNEGCAPVLQEQEDDQEHENHGLDQGVDNFLDRFHDEFVGVNRRFEDHAIGKGLAQLVENRCHAVAGGNGVCARQKIDTCLSGDVTVVVAGNTVVLRAELDPRYVLQKQARAVLACAYDDVFKFLDRSQTSLGVDLPGHEVVCGRGRVAKAARRKLLVLFGYGCGHIRNRQAVLSHEVGLEPHTHAVVRGTEGRRIANACHTLDFVKDVDFQVVGQIDVAVAVVRGVQAQKLQEGGRTFGNADALISDFLW